MNAESGDGRVVIGEARSEQVGRSRGRGRPPESRNVSDLPPSGLQLRLGVCRIYPPRRV
jgi:hypothetical protein